MTFGNGAFGAQGSAISGALNRHRSGTANNVLGALQGLVGRQPSPTDNPNGLGQAISSIARANPMMNMMSNAQPTLPAQAAPQAVQATQNQAARPVSGFVNGGQVSANAQQLPDFIQTALQQGVSPDVLQRLFGIGV